MRRGTEESPREPCDLGYGRAVAGPSSHTLLKRIGQRVKGRYRLEAVIGTGGQGAVYGATDERDGDRVAIKVLHEEVRQDPAMRERLLREARALMALQGTAALAVLDQGFTEDGYLALVTEFLVGEELGDYLSRNEVNGARMNLPAVFNVFAPIADTLARAHAMGIVHRDLKPANVFLCSDDPSRPVRLMDFGFAKFGGMKSLTMAGFIAGSPSYLSPEAWRDQPVSPSMDVYGFSAMLYRVLAGEPPFSGSPIELLRKVTQSERPSLHALRSDLSPRVDDWVQMALAVNPDERFQNAGAALAALRRIVG